jgi:hypothetical protein
MSKETLSVDLDPALIDRVRRYSERNGTDVSGTISELISTLPATGGAKQAAALDRATAPGSNGSAAGADWERNLPPITRSLLGIASGGADEDDYKDYLWRKYGP